MAPKLKNQEPIEFVELINVDECKELIRGCVAEVAKAHREVDYAKDHPRTMSAEEAMKIFGVERHDITTVSLARDRLRFWEDVQDRLWAWYRRFHP